MPKYLVTLSGRFKNFTEHEVDTREAAVRRAYKQLHGNISDAEVDDVEVEVLED